MAGQKWVGGRQKITDSLSSELPIKINHSVSGIFGDVFEQRAYIRFVALFMPTSDINCPCLISLSVRPCVGMRLCLIPTLGNA